MPAYAPRALSSLSSFGPLIGESSTKPSAACRPGAIERSGRRKTLPKLIKCALRRPVAAIFWLSVLRSLSRRADGSPHHLVVRCLSACLERNARPGRIAGLHGNLTVAEPCFQGTGEAVESLLSRATSTTQDAGPIPDGSVCTPDLSMTGRHEFTTGQKGGDNFFENFF